MSHIEVNYLGVTYCSLCDQYFPTVEARAAHVQFATNHPKCEKCNTRYANGNALRNHYVISTRHHYCSSCRVEFRTAAGFRAHIEFAAIHCGDPDDDPEEDQYEIDDSYEGWEDDAGAMYFPDENDDHYELPVHQDNVVDIEEEYWDVDDEPPPQEDEEADYNGWAPVPPEFAAAAAAARLAPPQGDVADRDEVPSATPSNSSRSGDAPTPHICTDVCKAKDQPCLPPTVARTTSGPAFVGCPLCLEEVDRPCVTLCGHVFCAQCITQALNTKSRCPVCRVTATPKQLRRIFFSMPLNGPQATY